MRDNTKNLIAVNVLDLDENEVTALAHARMSGLIKPEHELLSSLADNGAQALRHFGREAFADPEIKSVFEITAEDNELMQSFFLDPELQKPMPLEGKRGRREFYE